MGNGPSEAKHLSITEALKFKVTITGKGEAWHVAPQPSGAGWGMSQGSMAARDVSQFTGVINPQPGVDTLWLSSGSESTGLQLGLVRTDGAIQSQDQNLTH